MASNSAGKPPTEEVQKLYLDEPTGEKVSKSELKRREKERTKAAKKAAEAPSRPPPAAQNNQQNGEELGEHLGPEQYFKLRSREIQRLKETRDPNPFPHKFEVKTDIRDFIKEWTPLKKGETKEDVEVQLAGRVYLKRSAGKNLMFYTISHRGIKIQVMCSSDKAAEDAPFEKQHEHIQRGDIIGVTGFPGRTSPKGKDKEGKEREGELSVMARKVTLLTPCLHNLPKEHFGFKDPEQRFRQRHLDLIINQEVRDAFIARGKMIDYIRAFFKEREFLEVETPMMNQIAGGATAKPFKTFHNAYNQELFMRVAPELYLKELIVGGLDRVFELGKQFRNEDADLTHNPEFTTCEFYMAYADVYDIMDMTEELVSGMVKHVTGGYETIFHTQSGEEYKVNWQAPWPRVKMMPALEKATGEKFPPNDQLHTEETNEFLKRIIKKCNVECPPPLTNARMIDKLVGEFIEEKCINPTFITEHPMMMSPLAKSHRSDPGLCERFEAFVCKKEIVNAYTELNDPFDQRLRFEEQANQKAQGDDEAQLVDEVFCESLEWGLPPTGGWGMGIDRMAMFLTDNYSIREVLAFPFMKQLPQEQKGKLPLAAEQGGVRPMPAEDLKV